MDVTGFTIRVKYPLKAVKSPMDIILFLTILLPTIKLTIKLIPKNTSINGGNMEDTFTISLFEQDYHSL